MYNCVFFRNVEYCGKPVFEGHVTLSKASASIEKFHDGTNATFECKSGYKPVNSNASIIAKCKGKRWTSLELTCKGKAYTCPFLLYQCFVSFFSSCVCHKAEVSNL